MFQKKCTRKGIILQALHSRIQLHQLISVKGVTQYLNLQKVEAITKSILFPVNMKENNLEKAVERLEKTVEEVLQTLELLEQKLKNKSNKKIFGKKNSHLHLLIETYFLEQLKEEAEMEGVSLAHLCRKRLREN